MNKIWRKIGILTVSFLLAALPAGIVSAENKVPDILIDGEPVVWDKQKPVYEVGGLMVPAGKLAESLGGVYFTTTGDSIPNTVLVLNDRIVLIASGSNIYHVVKANGQGKTYKSENINSDKMNLDDFISAFEITREKDKRYNLTREGLKKNDAVWRLWEDDPEKEVPMKWIRKLFQEGNYGGCVSACDDLIVKNRDLLDAYTYKATAFMETGDWQGARETLNALLAINPKNAWGLYQNARAAARLGLPEEALRCLAELFQMDPFQKSRVRQEPDFDGIRSTDPYRKMMEISVVAGGRLVDFDVPPRIQDDRTLVPLRKIFEALGATVSYEEETQRITALHGNTRLVLYVGQKEASVNGESRTLDVPAQTVNGRTMVPVRFVAEALNGKVDWEEENEVITITTAAPSGSAEKRIQRKDFHYYVSMVRGDRPQPYFLTEDQGLALILLQDRASFDAFNAADEEERKKVLGEILLENSVHLAPFSPIAVKLIYNGSVYYTAEYRHDDRENFTLHYYEKGMPVNVIKQDSSGDNYRDFSRLQKRDQESTRLPAIVEKFLVKY